MDVLKKSLLGALVSGTHYPQQAQGFTCAAYLLEAVTPLRDRGYLVLQAVSAMQILCQSINLSLVLRQLLSPAWEAGMGKKSRDNAHGRCIRNHLLRSAEVHRDGSARLSTAAVK